MKWCLLFILGWMTVNAQGMHDWQTITYMNDITDMVINRNEIWVSSTGGVYKFLPEDSTYQAFSNIEGLGSIDLTSIVSDKYDNIVAASRDGLINRYDRHIGFWKVYSNLKGEVIVDLFAIQDTLWVATNTGVGVFLIHEDDLEFRDFYQNFREIVNEAHRVAVYNHRIYFATENGLFHAPSDFLRHNLKIPEAWILYSEADGLPSNNVLDIVPTSDSLLVGTAAGAVSISEDNLPSELSSWDKGIVSRIFISDADVYFVRDHDYYKRIDHAWTWVHTENSSVTCGFIDNFADFWIGLKRGGIKKSEWDSSFLVDGPGSNHVGPVIKSHDGNLWISSGKFKVPQGEGFYKYDFDHWTNYKFYQNEWSRKNNVVYVYEESSGKIWFGSWGGGISVLDNISGSMDFYHGWTGEGTLEISTAGSKNEIIIPEIGDNNRMCFSPVPVSLDDYLVIPYFLEDALGNLWCTDHGAEDGNYIIAMPRNENGSLDQDCTNWFYFGRNIGFSGDDGQVSVLEFDDFNRLWIGTFATGILIYDYSGTIGNRSDDKALIRVNMGNASLFSNTILSLKRDMDGIMWIGTSGGLSSFDGQNFYKHVGEIGPIENKINAIFVDNYNNKWFATDGGVSILKADESPWDSKAWVHYTPENSGLPDKRVNSIFVDQKKGETYIGTESGLSIFSGSFSELKDNLESVVSGPSPYILDNNSEFIIKNLVAGASVKILNINGKLIKTLTHENGSVAGGRATWDGRDQNNAKVSSGIYIFLIYNDEGITGSGKIAIINP